MPSGLPSSLLSLSAETTAKVLRIFPPNFPFWKVYTRLTPRQGRQKLSENCPKIVVELLPSAAGQINIQLLSGSLCGQLESCLGGEAGGKKGEKR